MTDETSEPISDEELAQLSHKAARWRAKGEWLEPRFHGATIEKLLSKIGDVDEERMAWRAATLDLRASLDAERERADRAEADVVYLKTRVREIADELDDTALRAMEAWPKGANGPIAVAAYEAMAERQRHAVFMLRAALIRTERP